MSDCRVTQEAFRVAAAAWAAAGRASSTVSTARSSWALERNQASYADGGRCTPASSMAWKKAAYAAVSCVDAAAKSSTGSRGEEHREHRAGGLHDVRDAGLGQRLAGGGPAACRRRARSARTPRRWPAAAWSGRRWSRRGSPTACRPGRRGPRARGGPSGRRGRRTRRRAARRPSPCRRSSGRGASPRSPPSRPHWPSLLARKPVITSSLTNSAPWAAHVSARKALKPGSGGTTPMLPGAASVIEAGDPVAVLGERGRHGRAVVVGQHEGERGGRRGDAGGAGQREGREAGARPPPAASRRGRGSSRRTSPRRRGR